MLYLLVIGFISILGQTVLLRELNVAFYGIELIYSLALGVWLALTAVGALIFRRILNPSPASISRLLLALSLLLPADIVFVRAVRLIFSSVPGAYLPFEIQLLALTISLFPIGLLSGLIFQLAAKVYLAKGQSLATAYGVESLGGLVGGMVATISLKLGIQNLTVGLLCSILTLVACLLNPSTYTNRLFRAIAAFSLGCMILATLNSASLDRTLTAWNHPNLLDTRDSPYSRVTVTKRLGQVSVFENDALSFETEGTAAEEFVHLAALQHTKPRRVLILGGGIEGLIGEILQHSPEQVDYVEVNPVLLEMVVPLLPMEFQASLSDERVSSSVSDPRSFLANSNPYDLILIGMPEPTSGQANRFYTQEFFTQCAAKLNPGGIMAFRLKSSENFWTPQLIRRTTSIYRALDAAVDDILILPGSTNIFIASDTELSRQPQELAERLEDRSIHARLVSRPYLEYLFSNDRFHQIREIVTTESAPPNTDTRPICYQYTVMIWLSKFYPVLAVMDLSSLPGGNGVKSWLFWGIPCGSAVLFLLFRRHPYFRRSVLVFIAGLVGMVWETVLILQYQVKNGILFQDIGILLMNFMAGLALGALAVGYASRIPILRRTGLHSYGIGLICGSAILSISLYYRAGSSSAGSLLETSILLLASGFLVAGIFGCAGVEGVADQRRVIAPLYAADLFGGCLGSLAASLILIPTAGLALSAGWMAPLALASLLLLKRG